MSFEGGNPVDGYLKLIEKDRESEGLKQKLKEAQNYAQQTAGEKKRLEEHLQKQFNQ